MTKRWDEMTKDERVEAIRELLQRGFSAGAIARRVGAASRNVIIGLINRHIPDRPKTSRSRPRSETQLPRRGRARDPDVVARNERILNLRGNGRAVSNIAALLDMSPATIRTIISVANKNGDPRAAPRRVHERRVGGLVVGVVAEPRPQEPPAPDPLVGTVAFIDSTRSQCAWPMWGDRFTPDALVCGRPIAGEMTSYCSFHRARSAGAGTSYERAAAKVLTTIASTEGVAP